MGTKHRPLKIPQTSIERHHFCQNPNSQFVPEKVPFNVSEEIDDVGQVGQEEEHSQVENLGPRL